MGSRQISRIPKTTVLVVAIALTGCGDSPVGLERDIEAPIQTDGLEYELQDNAGYTWDVAIPLRYTNNTGRTIYVPNCNRTIVTWLEKEDAGEWVFAWGGVTAACQSPVIVVEPAATYDDTLHVIAGQTGTNIGSKFRVTDIDGIYRIVWVEVYSSYDPDARQPIGEKLPLHQRVSNRFRLRLPR